MNTVTLEYYLSLFFGALATSCFIISFLIFTLCHIRKIQNHSGYKRTMIHSNFFIVFICACFFNVLSSIFVIDWFDLILNSIMLTCYVLFYKIIKKLENEIMNSENDVIPLDKDN